jgi:hypothetical protein
LTRPQPGSGGGALKAKARDASQTNTIHDLARNGSLISSSAGTVTAGGLVRTENLDLNGDGPTDTRTTDTFAQQCTERVNTVNLSNRDGSLRTKRRRVHGRLGGHGLMRPLVRAARLACRITAALKAQGA